MWKWYENRVALQQAHNKSLPLPGSDGRTAVYDVTARTVIIAA